MQLRGKRTELFFILSKEFKAYLESLASAEATKGIEGEDD